MKKKDSKNVIIWSTVALAIATILCGIGSMDSENVLVPAIMIIAGGLLLCWFGVINGFVDTDINFED